MMPRLLGEHGMALVSLSWIQEVVQWTCETKNWGKEHTASFITTQKEPFPPGSTSSFTKFFSPLPDQSQPVSDPVTIFLNILSPLGWLLRRESHAEPTRRPCLTTNATAQSWADSGLLEYCVTIDQGWQHVEPEGATQTAHQVTLANISCRSNYLLPGTQTLLFQAGKGESRWSSTR